MSNQSGDSANGANATLAPLVLIPPYDLLCFSHLRWHFVTQRPQHLMNRFALERRVFFWEEPFLDGQGEGTIEVMQEGQQLWVLRPHLAAGGDRVADEKKLLDKFMQEFNILHFVRWYYTPMALEWSAHLKAAATIYDCMDELTGFLGAPDGLEKKEAELFSASDVVFTGGLSLYEAKKTKHGNIHAFPSSIDVAHFSSATLLPEPEDQINIARPRVGFYGVLDERFDGALVAEVAQLRPDIQFIFLGPVVKIGHATLPQGPNVHYLGSKAYADLPQYLAGWDVAILPFALNASTRFISPTKTPEYLAAGRPVVSTPIRDVVRGYGDSGLVTIAETAVEFAAGIDEALQPRSDEWRHAVAIKLADGSWDQTRSRMSELIDQARRAPAAPRAPNTSLATFQIRDPNPLMIGRREKFDYLVVGAGFAGSVLAERLARDGDSRVLIIDKRDHVGGNAYDFLDAAGILVHRYGPHIFHTNSDDVVRYLSRFTEWHGYEHRVLAQVDGMLLPIPINLDTINRLYGLSLDGPGMQQFLAERTFTPPTIRTSEDICVSRVGHELYEKFFRNYTRKQWGLDPSELDSSVAGRIPVRFDRDDRYFTDTFQAMPKHGFTKMFERMLDHSKITIRTGVNYSDVAAVYPGVKTIFTGPVDEFFDYRFGPLPYRSLEFKHETHNVEKYQSAAVVNYPNEHAYTRVTEFKYLTGQKNTRTSIVFEHPREEGDPYYPIPRPENANLYAKYKDLADRANNVHFVGRLASYKYYNMDQVVAQALALYRKIAGRKTPAFLPGTATNTLLAEAR